MFTFHVITIRDNRVVMLLFDLPIVLMVKKHKEHWMGLRWMVECLLSWKHKKEGQTIPNRP